MSDCLRVQVLRSGSAGNALLVEAGRNRLLIDAGLPLDAIARELAPLGLDLPDLTALLLTHEHDDHARSAGALSRATGVPVLANEATLRGAASFLGGVHSECFTTGASFRIGDLTIEPFPVPHDAVEPVGFLIQADGARVLVACDLGGINGPLRERLPDADLILIEANYDLRLLGVSAYPWFLKNRIISPMGHLSNEAAAEAALWAARAGRSQVFVLVHLSDVNNLAPLARDTVAWSLERERVRTTRVEVVRSNARSNVFTIPFSQGHVTAVNASSL